MDVEHLVLVRSAQLRRDEAEVAREEYVPHAGVAKLRDERVRGQAVCFLRSIRRGSFGSVTLLVLVLDLDLDLDRGFDVASR